MAIADARELWMWLAKRAVGVLTMPSATTIDTRWPAVPTGSRIMAALEKCLSPVYEVILRSEPGDTSNAARPVFADNRKEFIT